MLSSLRAIGYSLPAAVADIVDNSITASARRIEIEFVFDGTRSYVLFHDDGVGMTATEVIEAMRLGGHGPEEARSEDDLGRFGLGLKTASFSQCRRLTVASRAAGSPIATARWDLAHVTEAREWDLLDPGIASLPPEVATAVEDRAGTVVLWEDTDRIAGTEDERPASASLFRQQIRQVEEHLGAVFHRFLTGRGQVKLTLNGSQIEPWDPFMETHDATQVVGDEPMQFRGETIQVTAFVLPHRSRMTDAEHETGGRGDWNNRQGFYVYRNRRLLVEGDWMRMFASEEHHKLARIRVDLPNTLDADWQIDVKKAVARPPAPLREPLRRIARVTRRRASDIYRHRGKVEARAASGTGAFLWERRSKRGRIIYGLNRKHPLLEELLEMQPDDGRRLNSLLRLAEETVPVPLIVFDSAETPDEHGHPFETAADSDVLELMTDLLQSMIRRGESRDSALRQLAASDAFGGFDHLVQVLRERDDR